MKHFILGYTDVSRKGAVSVLYAGDSRAEARKALFAGGPGIVVADYVCNPQVSQSKRFRREAGTPPPPVKPPKPAPPEPKAKAEKPLPKPLPLPSKHGHTPEMAGEAGG
jgi:hypothetical protein